MKRALAVAVMLSVLAPQVARADLHSCVEAANQGQALRDTGTLSGAREAFVACSAAACPAVVRQSCEGWAAEIEPRVPTIVLGARDAGGVDLVEVRVTLDGAPLTTRLDGRAVPTNPGPHELVFEAKGFLPGRTFLVVREGEKVRPVAVTLTREAPLGPPAPAATHATELAAGGIALLGIGGFAVFGLLGRSQHAELEGTCAASRTCAHDDVSAVQTKYLVADVSLAIGIVGAVVLAALLVPKLLRH